MTDFKLSKRWIHKSCPPQRTFYPFQNQANIPVGDPATPKAAVVDRPKPRAGLAALEIMQERGILPGQAWHAYENLDLGSPELGCIKFVKIGVACTLKTPPPHYPDDSVSQGHLYRHIGTVDLVTGEITPCT